jgi:YbbR domain-containing protein
LIRGLFRNAGLKTLALLIAVALWVLVAGEEESVKVFTVPVDFAVAKDGVLSPDTPGSVQVRLRGSESTLRRITGEGMSLPLDLTSIKPGRRGERPLLAREVRGVPSGAAVDSVVPDRLSIFIERRVTRTLPVAVTLLGSPPSGHRLVGTRVEPEQVTVAGPESLLAQMRVAPTEPIPLRDERTSFTTTTSIGIEDPRIELIEPHSVLVRIEIEPEKTKQ